MAMKVFLPDLSGKVSMHVYRSSFGCGRAVKSAPAVFFSFFGSHPYFRWCKLNIKGAYYPHYCEVGRFIKRRVVFISQVKLIKSTVSIAVQIRGRKFPVYLMIIWPSESK